jgi:hypothetical protein
VNHWEFLIWGGVAYALSFAISLLVVIGVVIALPARYFLERPTRQLWVDQHPAIRLTLHVLKNLAGAALITAGVLLSLPGVPGQGILTVVIGILLLDFPGKLQFERKLVARPRVLSAINRIRVAFKKQPLIVDEVAEQ